MKKSALLWGIIVITGIVLIAAIGTVTRWISFVRFWWTHFLGCSCSLHCDRCNRANCLRHPDQLILDL